VNKWSRPFEWKEAPAGRAGKPAKQHVQHYFAFLSYSHADEADADWLHRELERFRVPSALVGRLTESGPIPKRLTPIFRDRHELAAADDLSEEIREVLAHSRCLVVLCSPAAARSKWTNEEIAVFKKLHPDGCIIAAVVAGEPLASDIPGREDEECFPPALVAKYNRRGKPTGSKVEPLAADLREGKGGRRTGFLKVVAGMLGVGLDDLVQREEIRRQRRLASIAGGSFAGMLVAGGLAVTAIQARDAARDQRREAESLVEFMLGDLREKLEPIGRLDALDGVGSRVLEYYSKQDTSELSDDGLLQRSRALNLTAQVAYQRGDMATAEQLYRQALEGTEEAVRRKPDDPETLYDHAQNIFWIGEIARRQGDLREAERASRQYKYLADQMVAVEPDNLRWRAEGAYGDVNTGIILYHQRQYVGAAKLFARASSVMQSLASIEAGNAEYQRELSTLLAWQADAEAARGNLQAAMRIRQREVDHLRRLVASNPADVGFRRRLIPAYQGLAILLSSTRGPASAIEHLQLAKAEADRLIPIEPDNSYWKGLAAQARLELADTLRALGRSADASAEVQTGCALGREVLAHDGGQAWRRLQTTCLAIRSRLALESDSNASALRLAEQSLAAARMDRSPDPTSDRYSIAAAYRLLGDVRSRMGDEDAAKAAWDAGLAQLPKGVAERPREMNERAKLLLRLGRKTEAQAIQRRLNSIGYLSVSNRGD
jgi:tetratricopeptide (TPR) repeat protein